MTLYETWIRKAYDSKGKSVKAFWNEYLPAEQLVYEKLLEEKNNKIKGTVSELSNMYKLEDYWVCGFLDGINGAINDTIDIENLEESTEIDTEFEFTNLYKKMVEYKAEHLYNLPQWNDIFDDQTRKSMFVEQKKSGTIVKEHKVGRNDPCPCGGGKKYKKCCGMNENAL